MSQSPVEYPRHILDEIEYIEGAVCNIDEKHSSSEMVDVVKSVSAVKRSQ
jgi:hypothetical protein